MQFKLIVADDGDDYAGSYEINFDGSPQLDSDSDGDGVLNSSDNCPEESNADQANYDADGQGDACDLDDDNDGLSDLEEAQWKTNPLLADTDGDGMSDGAEVTAGRNPTMNEFYAIIGVINILLEDQ